MRQEDIVCRLGGDEFVVVLEGLGQDALYAANQAEIIAEKVRFELNQPIPWVSTKHDIWARRASA